MVNGGPIVNPGRAISRARAISAASMARCSSATRSSPAFAPGCAARRDATASRPISTVYAKAVAAGFPLAMVGGRRDVMDTLLDKGVMHGGTYNGNVQSMAAALAALDVLEAGDGAVYRDLEARGTRLMQGLAAICRKHQVAARVQGLPAIFQVFFTEGPGAVELPRRRCL